MTSLQLALLCGLTFTASSQVVKHAAPVPEQTVTFRVIKDIGSRTAIAAAINGLPVTLEIHANAGFSMQLSHEAAKRGNITNLRHQDEFGIERAGKVSKLGRDTAFVAQLKVGNRLYSHVPVSVFETPSPYNIGMLGLRWLRANRVLLDYQKSEAVLNPQPATGQRYQAQLLRNGYVAIPLKRDPTDGRYLVPVTIGSVTRPMVVSTVAGVVFDQAFARLASLPQRATGGTYGGPTGTTGQVYTLAKPATIRLATTSFAVPTASIEDVYAYAAQKRPADAARARGGLLGVDFLAAHQAVVDFGNAVLYLKK